MKKKLMEILAHEDKKKPFTDKDLANQLNVSREQITELRIKLNIPNSRQRLDEVIQKDALDILNTNQSISHRELMSELNKKGYSISRSKALHILKKLKENTIEKRNIKTKSDTNIYTKKDRMKTKENSNKQSNNLNDIKKPFENIIGAHGSIRTQLRQAQASVLYPPKGLHTLLLGPSGSGKSLLAETMYQYAITSNNFSREAPFIVFNCADYAENPQLLLSQLFGYTKGAFTGADKDKFGVIEKANEGILFLDEVHRLPSEGQEILFSILDKGSYRRLGEVNNNRKVSLMIIAATTEDPQSSLLLTFRRRIPMVIELPSLDKRTYLERYEFIKTFFTQEAQKTNKSIIVEMEALKALMGYHSPGNIGQLKSDIQVSCAKALLNTILGKKDYIQITISELPEHVSTQTLSYSNADIISNCITRPLKVNIKSLSTYVDEPADQYVMPNKIYQFIERRTKQLEEQNLKNNEINLVISREIEAELDTFIKGINTKKNINKIELKNLVGLQIIEVVEECYQVAKRYYRNLQENFYYSLAIHLSATYERILKGKRIINPEMIKIKEKYKEEYTVALKLAEKINNKLSIQMPEEEIGFISMYLNKFSTENLKDMDYVGVIVLTHGRVGKEMVSIANKLLNTNHAIGIEMPLDENPQKTLVRTIEIIKKMDRGKGCILLVDMGSLITFGQIIEKETGIKIETIDRVDTLMVLEITRRSMMPGSTIEQIIHSIEWDKKKPNSIEKKINFINDTSLPKAIIAICITGEGTARKVKEYLEKIMIEKNTHIKIISIGVISSVSIDLKIENIMKEYSILAFIGTIDPEMTEVPFISIEDLFEGKAEQKINSLIAQGKHYENPIEKIIDEDLIILDIKFNNKNDAIDYIVEQLKKKGYVDSEFLLSVYKRESISSTFMNGNIAIPHGYPQHVIKPVISIIRLGEPIVWNDRDDKVKMIFLIAYKHDSKKYFKNFYKILMNERVIQRIFQSENKKEIKRIILEHATK